MVPVYKDGSSAPAGTDTEIYGGDLPYQYISILQKKCGQII
jgi:hypothetical protein